MALVLSLKGSLKGESVPFRDQTQVIRAKMHPGLRRSFKCLIPDAVVNGCSVVVVPILWRMSHFMENEISDVMMQVIIFLNLNSIY